MGLTNKFRVGDSVRGIKSGLGVAGRDLGTETRITNINGTYGRYTAVKTKDLDNPAFQGWIAEDSFELIERDWDR